MYRTYTINSYVYDGCVAFDSKTIALYSARQKHTWNAINPKSLNLVMRRYRLAVFRSQAHHWLAQNAYVE